MIWLHLRAILLVAAIGAMLSDAPMDYGSIPNVLGLFLGLLIVITLPLLAVGYGAFSALWWLSGGHEMLAAVLYIVQRFNPCLGWSGHQLRVWLYPAAKA